MRIRGRSGLMSATDISRLTVPRIFTPTSTSAGMFRLGKAAARWKIQFGWLSSSAATTSRRSVTSPSMPATPTGKSPARAIPKTSAPLARASRQRCWPLNPVAPVTRMRIPTHHPAETPPRVRRSRRSPACSHHAARYQANNLGVDSTRLARLIRPLVRQGRVDPYGRRR